MWDAVLLARLLADAVRSMYAASSRVVGAVRRCSSFLADAVRSLW